MAGEGPWHGAAPARARIKAFAYDYGVIFGYLLVLSLAGSFLTFGPVRHYWTDLVSTPLRTDVLAFVTAVLPVVLYFALGECSASAATWGKRRVGLRVVGPGGERPTFLRSLARSVLKFLPWQMAHTAMLHIPGFPASPGEPPGWSVAVLSLVWVLVAVYLFGLTRLAGGRTLYDRISGTVVELGSRGQEVTAA
jgi:uncharacterized RDD family membrane protein YckC